ncbi:DUF881 domain-containing protein [Kribbella jejuensis]|uniref:Uncharacterized protein YlxW (UPF0749 family) n=1 Tax=Kribbella jejuensis TaxID=236068 RepID=A0A542D9H6_9ACTN|nr:DUF881 domain-containing protein [Kribbella jejuensis]TQI99719.1 uncharacterized protein YlxW (UPF0749 family) [Kribbella jejuensis]
MSLLNNLMAHPIDEGYAVAARTRSNSGGTPVRSRHRIMLVIAAAVLGFLLAIAAAQNYRAAPEAEKQRKELIDRINQADDRLNELRTHQSQLSDEVRGLQASGLSNDSTGAAVQQKLDDLELQAGAIAVTGPGIKAVIDDAKNADAKEGRLLDVDLQQLVNGLWTSGAEAISVNGHRLTSLTAIRGAGSAITVDYSSLTPPYTVLAIGDTATMPARFAQSSGGQWVQYLVSNFDVRMTITTEDSLLVPADATIALRYAKVKPR